MPQALTGLQAPMVPPVQVKVMPPQTPLLTFTFHVPCGQQGLAGHSPVGLEFRARAM
jgi:hypothetical protein